ncbi:MFS transporter [Nonomuraea roseola]|uniref:MFS transporter n=1 Tax=Nonomuraea roseola TaxID=46179 RepID=A0ABV5Q6N8_9ACTN
MNQLNAVPFLVLATYTLPMVTLADTARDLGAGPTGPVWILSSIALGLSALLLVAGGLADDYGRKRTLVIGTCVLAGAGVVAALATSVPVFAGARLVQGGAGAAMLAASLGIVGHTHPAGRPRLRATAAYGAMMGLGTAVGPLLSGMLALAWSWRTVYWLTAALALVLAIVSALTLKESRSAEPRRLDLPGVVLLTLGVAALVTGVTEGRQGWTRPVVAVAFVAAALLLVAFTVAERRRREPLLDLDLFRRPPFLVSTGGAMIVGATVVGVLGFLPSVLQSAHGMTPMGSALLLAIWSCMSFLTPLLAGRVRLGAGSRLSLGLLLSAAGYAGLLGVAGDLSLPLTVAGLLVSGVGSGLINSSLAHLAIESVPQHRVSMGSGASNTARYVGSSLGAAAMATLVGTLGLQTGVLVTLIASIVLKLAAAGAVQAHLLAVPAPLHRAPLPGPRV